MMIPQQQPVAEQQHQGANAAASTANSLRLRLVTDRLAALLRTGHRSELRDFFHVCVSLARAIDYTIANNEVPSVVHDLPPIIKQVYERKNEVFLQPAIMVLMISIKNACRNGWFRVTDTDEFLTLANEISSLFCSSVNFNSESSNAIQIISKITPRFYPKMRIGHILVSLEAKPGYEILVTDFNIPKHLKPTPQERIRLFVAQVDDVETSSCIISPPQVNFLLNGKGVERRTNVSMDIGPQFPTDVTGMLKIGTNLIQAIGQFNGNYIIAIAFMTIVSSSDTIVLQDYVPPFSTAFESDGEVIEGPSRISLNCPISYKRIKTPVKGYLCKHHQCFDYENFMEINSRKPSWRCPHCNQPVSCPDLRIDQKMVQVLREVGEDIVHVLITADGSWKVIADNEGHTDQLANGSEPGESNKSSNVEANVVDLTMEEIDDANENSSSTGMGYGASESNAIPKTCMSASETEDRKPSQDVLRGFSATENLSEPPVVTATSWTGHAAEPQLLQDWSRIFFPASVVNGATVPVSRPDSHRLGVSEPFPTNNFTPAPVLTDAVSPAPNREAADSRTLVQPTTFQNTLHVRQYVATEDMQIQHSRFGTSIISGESERPSIPRHVSYAPIAVQALPAQLPGSFQRPRTTTINSNLAMPNGGPSSFDTANSDVERQQYSSRQQTNPLLVPDLTSPSSLQLHSMGQDFQHHHNQQFQQDVQHHQNQPFQQVISLPAMTQVGTRRSTDQQRIGGVYRGPGSSQDQQDPHHQHPPNPSRVFQTTNQQAIALMATQRAAQMARPVQLQPARSGPSYPMSEDALRLSISGEQRWNLGGAPPVLLPMPEAGMAELPSEQNWRPTGLMRGSLARHRNNPAYSQYLAQQAQPPSHTQARLSAATAQLPALVTNSINAHRPSESYTRTGDLSRHGSSGIPHQHL